MLKTFATRISAGLLLLIINTHAYSWNSLGHRLIAQIAYDNLNSDTKNLYNNYNHNLDKVYGARNLVNAAPWLDSLRYLNELWLQPMHYIDIPFSRDGTALIQPDATNAVSAIEKATSVLKNKKASPYDKGFSLRILLHVVGDIHQPMHGVSEFSSRHPGGDMGGNLFHLAANPVGTNLHSYWDNAGGWLKGKKHYSRTNLAKRASSIEKHWPCDSFSMGVNPKRWAHESYQLAVNKAYTIKVGQKPSKSYQRMVRQLSEQRIAIAGCRLAYLLNEAAVMDV
ncbi:MAG: S1/P1 nuclease [Legionella sp.]|nr:S1/P1 nuclease [Legionella sp.]